MRITKKRMYKDLNDFIKREYSMKMEQFNKLSFKYQQAILFDYSDYANKYVYILDFNR